MNFEYIEEYLDCKITNSWYRNSKADYGINGKFLCAEAIKNDLKIIWEEDGQQLELVIAWYKEYTPEQLYSIWMETA